MTTMALTLERAPEIVQEEFYPCLHELFESQADLRGDAPALICGDISLSYIELENTTNRLARYLRAHGAGKGNLIGLFFEKSHLPIISILACLKAGAGYVPLDPGFPDERLNFIATEAEISLVVTEPALKERASTFFGGAIVSVDSGQAYEKYSSKRLSRNETKVTAEDVCYVLYTSGSTGRPKGVVTLHKNVSHFASAFNRVCMTNTTDRIYQGFALCFDGSVEEIWMAFSNGATLVAGTKDTPKFGNDLARFLRANGVTYFSTVPTMLSTMTDPVPCLRQLVVSGEACPPELVARWARDGLLMLNVYGPTEATVNTTAAVCQAGKPVTIGRPLDGYLLHILDSEGRPVKDDEKGELFVSGVTLAKGYLKQPELTERAFRPDKRFGRLYKTGDLVRRNEDGEIEFFGRIDNQVKIRGFRVELSEIEAVLFEQPEVSNVAVILAELRGTPCLAAYITVKTGETADRARIAEVLRSRLPRYMVPTFLEELPSFPLLASGKVDRKKLPEAKTLLAQNSDLELPETELEKKVAAAWCKTLSVNEVGVEQDFFLDLGGHSLLAAKLAAQLRDDADINIPVRDIYNFPTIRKLAAHLDVSQPSKKFATPAYEPKEKTAPVVIRKPSAIFKFAQAVSIIALLMVYSTPLLFVVPILEDMLYGRVSVVYGVSSTAVILFALWPVLLLTAVGSKWLIIGKYKPGRHPLWGSYYFRWWLVSRLEQLSGAGLLVGTPLLPVYYRLMGAKVGRHCSIDSGMCSAWDLITIGNETSIGADTQLLGYKVENGHIIFGTVNIGKRCFIGLHCSLGLNVSMGDDAKLDDQSALPDGRRIWVSEAYRGSPARPANIQLPVGMPYAPSHVRRVLFGAAQLVSSALLSFLAGVPALTLALVLVYVRFFLSTEAFILLAIVMVPTLVVTYCVWIAFCKWLVLPRGKPGIYKAHTVADLRFWLAAGLMRTTRAVMLPVFTTLYLPPWMRLLGAKVGENSEMSTVFAFLPELLDAGAGSFFADGSIVGGRRTYLGRFEVGICKIGERTFMGNSSILPAGASIGDNCLLGVLSSPPEGSQAIPNNTDWLGSPGFRLPNRQKVCGFDDTVTFLPTTSLYVQRAIIDALRILIPAYAASILSIGSVIVLIQLHKNFGSLFMLGCVPLLALVSAAFTVGLTVGLKWAIMGRFNPVIVPLWSRYVWLNEMVNGVYESMMAPIVNFFSGTAAAPMLLRLLGCNIGEHCFINTSLFSEFDLVWIGNGVALNYNAIIQNHLFEDRIMKSSYLDIGDGCSVGNMSVVLYDSRMGDGAVLGSLSLLMKGEVMPSRTRWYGIPTVQG